MRNFIQDGDILDHTAGSAITGGAPVAMGDSVGVAVGDIASGGAGSVAVEGVYELPKVSGTAWTQGQRLTLDVSAGALVPTSGHTADSGDVEGAAIAADDAPSGATVGAVKLANPGTAA
jgi:predicted RecA/RadA family phage recombinase